MVSNLPFFLPFSLCLCIIADVQVWTSGIWSCIAVGVHASVSLVGEESTICVWFIQSHKQAHFKNQMLHESYHSCLSESRQKRRPFK